MAGEPGPPGIEALVLPPSLRDRIVTHLSRSLPNEGVGLLAVEWLDHGGQAAAQVRRFYPGSNIRASPTRYEMDPRELIAALRDIDANGWALGAIVHSHPRGPATPSRTDLDEFQYPEALMVIVSFATALPVTNAWRLEPESGSWSVRPVPVIDRMDPS
jgi:proteasome lid subunit RPN8/RPN11